MGGMVKTNIYLTDKQRANINALCIETGLSGSELVRRIIDKYFDGEKDNAEVNS